MEFNGVAELLLRKQKPRANYKISTTDSCHWDQEKRRAEKLIIF